MARIAGVNIPSWRRSRLSSKPRTKKVLRRNGFRDYVTVRKDAAGGFPLCAAGNVVLMADYLFINRFYVERRAFVMSKGHEPKTASRSSRVLSLFTDRGGWTSGGQDYAVGTVKVNAAAGGPNVVRFPYKRSSGNSAEKAAGAGKKYQLQLRVDRATLDFIKHLLVRSEAESMSELIRLALREYERVLYEYHEIRIPDVSPTDGSQGRTGSRRSTIGVSKDMHPASGKEEVPKRLSFFLHEAPIKRLERLADITNAVTRTDVIKMALCVLDTKLAEYESVLSQGDAVASITPAVTERQNQTEKDSLRTG